MQNLLQPKMFMYDQLLAKLQYGGCASDRDTIFLIVSLNNFSEPSYKTKLMKT